MWVLAVVVGAAVVAGTVALASSDPPSPPEQGTPVSGEAPQFELEGLRDPDRTMSLSDFRGRPVVLNFFASWCAPCRREMPAFESAYEKVKDDVAFVGIDNQDIRSDGVALLEETGVSYPAVFDPEGDVAREFVVLGMPTTIFVSPEGEMLERVTGEMNEDRLLAAIDRLFPGERPHND
ncbi:MAG: TlpA family protein disulfide reductase [Acidimicrobiia bacterium]